MNALAPLRHDCSACGACCNNVRVRFVDEAERDRIRAIATELGRPDALDDEKILHQKGICPFLEEGWKCAIHAAHGLDAKPLMCKTFPVFAVQTESGQRVGIDPASRAFRTTRRSGPALEWAGSNMVESALSPPEVQFESAILGVAQRDGASVGLLAGLLSGARGHMGPQLPPGLAERIAAQLQRIDFHAHIQNERIGFRNRDALTPLADWLVDADPAHARFELTAEQDSYARDAFAAMLFLRLPGPSYPSVHAGAFVVLMGIVASALPQPTPEAYGASLTAWLRLMRAPAFWRPLIPSAEAMIQLIRGLS